MIDIDPARSASRLAAGIAAVAVCAAIAVAVPTSANAATKLRCSASMSNSHPRDYSSVEVNVRANAAQAAVRTTAYYRSTDTTHTGKTDQHGRASIGYRISRATPGYKVKVVITVKSGKTTANCSTSFMPS